MRKRILEAALVLAMCLGLCVTALAWVGENTDEPYPVVGGNIYLCYSEGDEDEEAPAGYWVSSCDETVTEAVIPASVDGKPVIGIYIYTFQGLQNLESVTIPESVVEMGAYVFEGSANLKNVTILGGISYIDMCDFESCVSLESVAIPASVTDIYQYAFGECESLKDVYYAGSESDWKSINIEEGNEALTSATIHYNEVPDSPAASSSKPAAPAQPATAAPTSAPVLVNGEKTAFDAYEINGNNYFKLRDLAYVLNGTDKQFEIAWDGAANAISLTSGAAYTAVGGEMTAKGAGKQNAVRTTAKILLDGEEVSFTAYEIGGNNYFKLRDVGEAFDFGVDWDDAAQTIRIDTSKGYTVG